MDQSAIPLRFPAPTPPQPGEPSAIAPGILWLRMPLPFALNHINLWLIDDGAGWAIVDTGYAAAATMTCHWRPPMATAAPSARRRNAAGTAGTPRR